jgi:sugar/nucleoside kinase (ribokinase family)
MNVPDVVVAGHICLDIIPALGSVPDLRPGGLVVAGRPAISTGGPVGNVGMALHNLGVPVRLMGKIGDDEFGGLLLDVLRAHDEVLAEEMIVVPGETTSYSVVVSPPGVDRAFLHCPGANDTFAAADVPHDALAGARIFHFGYPPLMRRLYADGGAELRRLLEDVRTRGLVTSLDVCHPDPRSGGGHVDWEQYLRAVLPAVDVFAPSLDELSVMLHLHDAEALDTARLRALGDRVLAMGPAFVVLKLGEHGLYVRTSGSAAIDAMCARLALTGEWCDRELYAPCFQPERIAGTTGAGDCTIAGLLAALLRGEDPVSAITSASAVGACSVEAPDATSGVPRWDVVAARLAAGWPRLAPSPALAGGDWRRGAHGTLFAARRTTLDA